MTKKQKLNLHLTHDNKFFDLFIRGVNNYSTSKNKFIIVQDGSSDLKFVKSKNVNVISFSELDQWLNYNILSEFDSIYIHFLSPKLARFLLEIPKSINVVLIFWGSEIFGLKIFSRNNLMIETSKVVKPILHNEMKFKFAFKPKNLILELQSYLNKRFEIKNRIKALKRIDYFAHYIKEDFDLIARKMNLNCKYVDFHYGGVYEVIQRASKYQKINKEYKIQIGNSGDFHNNHLDLFEILKRQKFRECELICPLSYSGSKQYVDAVIAKGNEIFKNNFTPLLDFLPLEDYDSLISSCSVMIMGHIRSQAAANIISASCFGVRVYMPSESTLFRYLKRIGLIIHALEEINKIDINISPLTKEEAEWNCLKLSENFGKDVTKQQFQNCLDKN